MTRPRIPVHLRARFPLIPVAAIVVAALAGCQSPPPTSTSSSEPPFDRVTFLTIASFDGHNVPVTIYRPVHATAAAPVPVVLHSHGWGGSRETRLDAFKPFTDAGLGVVSIDMRGHGEARATSQAHVASPDFEIRDVMAVISYLANQTWVRQESPGDPLVGAMGESYGGAFPLLTAALDPRLDAVVSEDTWHDLVHAMAPNRVPKTAWFASLWLSASIQGRIHPDVRTGFEDAIRTGTVSDALAETFGASSPVHYPGQIRVPTLLMQGDNDTLFGLGEAFANYAEVKQSGAQTSLVTHLAGHSVARGGGPSGGPRANGTEVARTSRFPCGAMDDLALSWFRSHLLGGSAVAPLVCITLDDGSAVRAASYPLPGKALDDDVAALRIQLGNVTSRDASDVLTAAERTVFVGAPHISGQLPAERTDGILYLSLHAVDAKGAIRTVNGQVTPLRVEAAGPATFSFDLAPIALDLQAGETLRLAVAAQDATYAAPGQTAPGPIEITELRLTLPMVCEACIDYST